jgi:uncharacterized phage-associated protein
MMKNPFHFQYPKAAQAVAALLRLEEHRRMNYYRLLKLIYIADRRSLQATGRPIVGGRLIAMERGPLHSTGFDLINGTDIQAPWWSQFFRVDNYDLEMLADPGNGDLSKREIELLHQVSDEFKADDEWEVGRKTHAFGEFKKNEPSAGKSCTIPFEDLLEAIGRAADVSEIQRDATTKSVFDRVFGA